MSDFLFRGSIEELDPALNELIELETERQFRKLILIPSESAAPAAVREALGSTFQNIYAEGYPDEDTRFMDEEQILDLPERLAYFRRYSDPRYYKGVEYADVLEALARRRCAEAFATDKYSPDQLFVNVQPLSGAPANMAVYTALINPGDTIMGMNLLHGGHLTHGSSVNRSGKWYKVVHYTVDRQTEKIDYDQVEALAQEHKPKIIIAGYSSYPWVPDWARFRAIADSVGAFLLTDISHIAGLIAGKAIPSPVGHAHIITFTTHKTMCGPRSACIITTSNAMSKKIDRGVFPGEQGGPHLHAVAGLALTFKLAQTDQFKQLQAQIVKNCKVLTDQLANRGLRIPFGGTDTHLANVDCKSVKSSSGAYLTGDMAARILDLAGIVLNRNTIPGDTTAMRSTGIRFGAPWITQRGLKENDMLELGNIMADVLQACQPYELEARHGDSLRAKVDFEVLENARVRVRTLCEKAGADLKITRHGYPHFFYHDDKPAGENKWASFDLRGTNLKYFLNFALTSDVEALKPGESQNTRLNTPRGSVDCVLTCEKSNLFRLSMPAEHSGWAAAWLRDLSDGFVAFDADLARRIPGPITVSLSTEKPLEKAQGEAVAINKVYAVGLQTSENKPLPEFSWNDQEPATPHRTPLYENHVKLGAKMIPFAGWEMPVWYSGVSEEHAAVRQAAGLFDIAHMGVYQVEGDDASVFLDSVCANDISQLAIGESLYTHFLDPNANVIDDLMVYRRGADKYLVVVNASNDDKDWAWLNAVKEGKVLVDAQRPWARAFGRNAVLRNLRLPSEGKEMRLGLALQGPRSRDILHALGCDAKTKAKINSLLRTQLCEGVVGGFDLVISRTGYTGEKMAFELFVHPDKIAALWDELLKVGADFGLKPCGLGSRDSLRTEAGLPLYGHEMNGQLGMGAGEAGFGTYVKTYKPWFVGRKAFLEREAERKTILVRFRFNDKGVRMAHLGDPVLDIKGNVIGVVSSCAIDSDGYLTGQAFVHSKSSDEGTSIAVFQSAPTSSEKPPAQWKPGDRIKIPSPATIISRFPKM